MSQITSRPQPEYLHRLGGELCDAIKDVVQASSSFYASFELVFEVDWEMTRACICKPDDLILPTATFCNPGVSDESNNWWNRGSLLAEYRRLQDALTRLADVTGQIRTAGPPK